MRLISFQFAGQPDSETDTPAQMEVAEEDEEETASSKQEVSTNKWTYPLPPRHFQLEITAGFTLASPPQDGFFPSVLLFFTPSPLIAQEVSGLCAQLHCS